jgi:hypothetical protein
VLPRKAIGFREEVRARGEREFHLSGDGATGGFAREPYSVVEFVVSRRSSYWLALVLRFQLRAGSLSLSSSGIIVFEGQPSDPRKTPLFRAEWHEWGNEDAAAQPHWHVYRPRPAVSGEGTNLVERQEGDASPAASGTSVADAAATDIDDFHFAMCTRWASRVEETHRHVLTPDAAIFWLGECIRYCRTQLEALSR